MQRLIIDTNVLIDLQEGLLIESAFQLAYRFLMPDILFFEELDDENQYFLDLGLQYCALKSKTMQYAMELTYRYNHVSRNDCFALALAVQEQCLLLTGDKALRKIARTESVKIKGTLWLVESMIRQQLININQAQKAYAQMKVSGRRLPWLIADERLKKL